MKSSEISFFEWQARFSNEEKCLKFLTHLRWPEGFQCPQCGHDHGYALSNGRHECAQCHYQSSVTAGTVFHSTKLPLTKWFWAIYWVASDKGGISALRLTKLIDVNWRTAQSMLRKLRVAMGHRDSLYRLDKFIELDDALVGGARSGKRGRGAEGKRAVLVACEDKGQRAGFMAIEAVEHVDKASVREFAARHLNRGQTVITDALPALGSLSEHHEHIPEVTPPELADVWLPWVHVVIANLKRFLLGTFHGVSGRYLQEYLNEFCYRFNRRTWEGEIPHRLMRLCVEHRPVILA